MDSHGVFERFASQPHFGERLSNVVRIPAQEAKLGEIKSPLHSKVSSALEDAGIKKIYSHQAEAIDNAILGNDVVVVTGTSSGKTLCYNVPVIQSCLTEPVATALYIFPTKALAQDQAGKLSELIPEDLIRVGVYDGDTPKSQRRPIRQSAHVVVTNPDMLHIGILPQHESWARFFKSLRYIVIDEMHSYRGVFGSHVGGIIRRLLRLCEWYRSSPVIVGCSATISNPDEHFEKLTSRKGFVINKDGAPKSERVIALVEPPSIEENDVFSPNRETGNLLGSLCEEGVRSLAFCRARISTELVVRYAREGLGKKGKLVESYRGGYTAKERRAIEQKLFSGKLTGLATTSAMELGVDVGGLDAVILNGYPGSLSSFWQQVGRAGRGVNPGFSVMFAHEDPLEQFVARNPEVVLDGAMESVTVNPDNPHVLTAQLRCAAYERPIAPEELGLFGNKAETVVESLVENGDFQFSAGRFFYPSYEAPAPTVNIRGIGGENVSLVAGEEVVGEMESWRAMQYAHNGAVYMHRSKTFLVSDLNLEQHRATIGEADPKYYTSPIVQSVVQSTVKISEKSALSLSGVSVTTIVQGFRKMAQDGRQILGEESLNLPATEYDTIGIRISFVELLSIEDEGSAGAVHALEHALTSVAPIIAGCDRRDIGSAWFSADPDDLSPAIYLFDEGPGGVGLCEKLFEQSETWFSAALKLMEGCDCDNGCPACLYSSQCESLNENLNKIGAIELLKNLIDLL